MSFRKAWFFGLLIFITMALTTPITTLAAIDCTTEALNALELTDEEFGEPVTFTLAKMVEDDQVLPKHCHVEGTIYPEIYFAVQLPTAWNERFLMTGIGGAAGIINYPGMTQGLIQGFASAASNTGHYGHPFDFSWAYPPDDTSLQRIMDFFSGRGNHETAVVVKKIIKAYYGFGASYSYWAGCSGAGTQGMMAVMYYPEDFDGVIINAPAIRTTSVLGVYAPWILKAMLGDGKITLEKLPIITDAIYRRCDSVDGLVDGSIEDPDQCEFDASKDLPKCPLDVDGPECFTTGQINALQKIYGGVRNSAGEILYYGAALGSEEEFPGIMIVPGAAPPFELILSNSYLQNIAFYPDSPGPSYDWTTFDFDTDPQKMEFSSQFDLVDPDLRSFKERGGKIIYYHGMADPNIQHYEATDYYQDVMNFFGKEETKEFFRLYLVPGVNHCGRGGRGCFDIDLDPYGLPESTFDMLPALRDWVEDGIVPELIGHHVDANKEVTKSRPLCSYPDMARYIGEGSIEDDENFICVETVPMKRALMWPKALDLNKDGKFSVLFKIPRGYHIDNFSAVVCEGAKAERVRAIGKRDNRARSPRIYMATFNKQDFINIETGRKVNFTVTAMFEHNGQSFAFEGSNIVRVK